MGSMKIQEKQKLSSADCVVEDLKNDREFMSGILAGVEDCKKGRVRRWSEIKKELGIK